MRSLVRVGLCAAVVAVVGVSTPASLHAQCSAGGTVSNVTDCVPVGTDSRDCLAEWSITPQPAVNGLGLPNYKILCTDNDPSCDADTTPGQCTFLIGACLNVVDTRTSCTTSDAASYVIGKPSVKDATKAQKDPNARNNRYFLDQDLAALVPTASTNVCTPQEKFVVALKKNGTRKRISKINLTVTKSACD